MIKHCFFLLFCISITIQAYSQYRIYKGYVGNQPFRMVTYSYSDGDTRAICAYETNDSLLFFYGRNTADSLILQQKDAQGIVTIRYEFDGFNSVQTELTGIVSNFSNRTTVPICLYKVKEFGYYDHSLDFDTLELLQAATTNEHYFNLLLSKQENRVYGVGVRVYEKITDVLVQEIALEYQLWGIDNIEVGDYNFDGIEDFSVFESSYAGPNTSRIYLLRDTATESFFVSEISGISLEFDYEQRVIFEHNQCCAGTRHMTASYTIVDNKMVLIEQSCIKYDEDSEEFIDVPCD